MIQGRGRGLALAAAVAVAGGMMLRRPASRIVRVSRVVAELDRAVAFYRDGLGFSVMSYDAGRHCVLRLGMQDVALVRFDPPGAPYPPDSRSDDLWFQHLAIVVSDMDAACRILGAHFPAPISVGGPQILPPRNGGVSAFKFRDPDGHPLELIHFPPGQGRDCWHARAAQPFLGIDHSALAVAATARSVRFYRRLGFHAAARSWNHGPAQARLDGLPGAEARITSLRPRCGGGMGLELLAYQPPGRALVPGVRDRVTDWLTIEVAGLRGGPRVLRDPDGHLVVLAAPPPPPGR